MEVKPTQFILVSVLSLQISCQNYYIGKIYLVTFSLKFLLIC